MESERLVIGVVVVLAAASVIGWIMSRNASEGARKETIANLNQRIGAWWIMVMVFVAATALGPLVSVGLFSAISFLALREFLTLTPTRRGDHRTLFWLFFVVVPVQYWLVYSRWYGLFAIFVPVWVAVFIAVRSIGSNDTNDYLGRVARIQWATLVCVYFISHAPALLMMLEIPGYAGRNANLLFFLATVVQFSDVLQYVFGKLFGRHPVSREVSPKKTWEGFLGGGFSATALGAGLWWMTPFSPLQAAGMAGVIVLTGFLGGLVMSAIKRDAGVKDWGHLIPGHGGMMDRLDSMSFAAPAFFHLTRYFFT
jgi:phosphatidate cytidylyltransferase